MPLENGHRELGLVRHGEPPASRDYTLAGWLDVPLTERGEQEAAALRPVLAPEAFAAVWSSDLLRAMTTARLAWGEPRPDRRLREIHFGELEGRYWPDLDPSYRLALERVAGFTPPGREAPEAVHAPIFSFVDEL